MYEAIQLIQEALPEAGQQWSKCWSTDQDGLKLKYSRMAFCNANLGYVHAMAHYQLSGQYDAPHGVCCALLLTTVEDTTWLLAQISSAELARIMGYDTTGLTTMQAAESQSTDA